MASLSANIKKKRSWYAQARSLFPPFRSVADNPDYKTQRIGPRDTLPIEPAAAPAAASASAPASAPDPAPALQSRTGTDSLSDGTEDILYTSDYDYIYNRHSSDTRLSGRSSLSTGPNSLSVFSLPASVPADQSPSQSRSSSQRSRDAHEAAAVLQRGIIMGTRQVVVPYTRVGQESRSPSVSSSGSDSSLSGANSVSSTSSHSPPSSLLSENRPARFVRSTPTTMQTLPTVLIHPPDSSSSSSSSSASFYSTIPPPSDPRPNRHQSSRTYPVSLSLPDQTSPLPPIPLNIDHRQWIPLETRSLNGANSPQPSLRVPTRSSFPGAERVPQRQRRVTPKRSDPSFSMPPLPILPDTNSNVYSFQRISDSTTLAISRPSTFNTYPRPDSSRNLTGESRNSQISYSEFRRKGSIYGQKWDAVEPQPLREHPVAATRPLHTHSATTLYPAEPFAGFHPPKPVNSFESFVGSGGRVLSPVQQAQRRPIVTATTTHAAAPSQVVAPTVPKVKMTKGRHIGFAVLVAVANSITQVAIGQVLPTARIIGQEAGANATGGQSWLAAAFILAVGAFILFGVRLGNIFGHYRIWIAGWIWLGFWSALAGFAGYLRFHLPVFLFCRGMQGIGPALLIPNGLAMLTRVYGQSKSRAIAFGLFGTGVPVGIVSGSLTGVTWAGKTWWPWEFWSLALIAWIMAVLSFFAVPALVKADHPDAAARLASPGHLPTFRSESQTKGLRGRIRSLFSRLNVPGYLGLALGLVLLSTALNNAPLHNWSAEHIIFLFLLGLIFLSFVFYVESHASYPIFPHRSLNRTTLTILVIVGFSWAAIGSWIFYIYRFFSSVRRDNPLNAALHFLALAPAGLLSSAITIRLLSKLPTPAIMLVSSGCLLVSTILAATMPAQQSYWAQSFPSVLLMALSIASSLFSSTIGALADQYKHEYYRDRYYGLATGMVYAAIFSSFGFGLGIAGGIYSAVDFKTKTPDREFKACQAAFCFSVGCAAVAFTCAIAFLIHSLRKEKKHRSDET